MDSSKCSVVVTDEDFNLFHTIDRELFTILIHSLGFDPALSMQVVALFLWIEKQSVDMYLVKRLINLPPGLLKYIIDEAVLCLKCAESDNFPVDDAASIGVSMLPEFMNNPLVSLRYFHENRIAVLRGVSEIRRTVCERAFRDILQQAGSVSQVQGCEVGESSRLGERRNVVMPPLVLPQQQPMPARQAGAVVGESSRMAERRNDGVTRMSPLVQPHRTSHMYQGDMRAGGGVSPAQVVGDSSRVNQVVGIGGGGVMGLSPLPQQPDLMYDAYLNAPFVQVLSEGTLIWIPVPPPPPPTPAPTPTPTPQVVPPQLGRNVPDVEQGIRLPVYDLEGQRELLRDELGQMVTRNLVIGGNREEIGIVRHGEGLGEETTGALVEEEVPAEDRTIFLTFSKGYPISEDEVRGFFTRKFGDFIEDLIMQEVAPGEQVLFARMVARSAAVIDGITEGTRAKYSINGKHVWARKFVKRDTVGESSSSQQANAPEE